MRYRHIFFDLDGTLLDSAPGVTNALIYALDKLGISFQGLKLTDFVGPPLQDSFQRRFGLQGEDLARAIALYREYYREKGMFEARPYPGITRLLADLQAKGAQLALATSKPEFFSNAMLEHLDLARYFTVLAGADLEGKRSSKADILRYALRNMGPGALERGVMIGDTSYDVVGAQTVGLPCIAVSYGYGSKASLRESGADWIVDSVEELGGLLLNGSFN